MFDTAPQFAATPGPALAGALARAAAAMARLDQALMGHPLAPAFLHRARLDAVRRQAAVDGQLIDPWHLAAVLEGLRLRMEGELRIIDRGAIVAAARHALTLHQWLHEPDFDQEGEVQAAEAALAAAATADGRGTPLLAAAHWLHAWLDEGRGRAPARGALVRFWRRQGLLRAPVPLTGAAALRADAPWTPVEWVPVFLHALAGEAEDWLELLLGMERSWLQARSVAAGGRRSTSRAAAAVDVMAAAPLVSATSLGRVLGMATKNAGVLLDQFRTAGVAVEVTHRSARRLWGLQGLAPLRDGVAPPRRPEPGRGRGRPPLLPADGKEAPFEPPPLPPVTRLERRAFDYSGLEAAMAHADQAVRTARRTLGAMRDGPTCLEHRAGRLGATP